MPLFLSIRPASRDLIPTAHFDPLRRGGFPREGCPREAGGCVNCCTIAQTFQSQQESPRRCRRIATCRAKDGSPLPYSPLAVANWEVWQTRRIKPFTRRLETPVVLISSSPRDNFSCRTLPRQSAWIRIATRMKLLPLVSDSEVN